MHIFYFDFFVCKIFCQILCHFLGKGCNKHPFVFGNTDIDFIQQVFYLSFYWFDNNFRVNKTCRTDDKFCYIFTVFFFVFAWCSTYKHSLINFVFKFFKLKRSVVKSTWQTETIFHKIFLSCKVATVHCTYLWDCNVRFVYKEHKILWEIIQQSCACFPWFSARKYRRIVFYAFAGANFLKHFHIVHCTLCNALCFDKLAFFSKLFNLTVHFVLNTLKGFFQFFIRYDVVACRENRKMAYSVFNFASKMVNLSDSVNFVAKELYAICCFMTICRIHFHNIATYTELIADKVHIVAFILKLNKVFHQFFTAFFHSLT